MSRDVHPMGNTRFTSEQRQERIEFYRDWTIRCYQMLGLDHWNIAIQFAPCSPDAKAECWRATHQYQAKLRFSDEWFDAEPEEQRQTLIHELLHCHMRPVWEVWEMVEAPLGTTAWGMFSRMSEIAEETTVDGLARAIAPIFPLPQVWGREPEEGAGEALRISTTTIFTDGETSERMMSLDDIALGQLAAALTPLLSLPLPPAPGES